MSDTISPCAFAIQDGRITRLRAQQIARTVVSFLAPGDHIGRVLVVEKEASLDVQCIVGQLAAE